MGLEILDNRDEIIFKGLAISGGIAHGRVCLFNEGRHNNIPVYKIEDTQIEKEKKRFFEAVSIAIKQIEEIIINIRGKLGNAEAEIFSVQKMILQDEAIHKKVLNELEQKKINAETAITNTLEFFESRILEMDNEYIKERATDIGEIKRRLLDILTDLNPSFKCAGDKYCQRGKDRIIVAIELTPSLTMEMDTSHTLGFVTERGGIASHAAILARAFKIPAVSGIKNIHDILFCSTEVLINGDTGELIIWPSQETLLKHSVINTLKTTPKIEDPIPGIKIMANLNISRDVNDVLVNKAEGIGLYRTEFEFLSSEKLLTEDEQYEKYSSVVKTMKELPVYFRLLDIGGDKTSPIFKLPIEENPYLGYRGCRLLLGRPDLFIPQARAIARTSTHAPVHVMYPMVIDLEQFLKLRNLFIKETTDIKNQNIKHGVMFEVPSACFQAKEILAHADFASIGSNDLVQYFFAVDRNNELVAYDYQPDREVFWNLIKTISNAAKDMNKQLSVCGEIANNPSFVAKLKNLGINTISVSPKLISELRFALNK